MESQSWVNIGVNLSRLLRFALVSMCLVLFSGVLNPGKQVLSACAGQEAVLVDSETDDSDCSGHINVPVAAADSFSFNPGIVFFRVEVLPAVCLSGMGFTSSHSPRAPPAA